MDRRTVIFAAVPLCLAAFLGPAMTFTAEPPATPGGWMEPQGTAPRARWSPKFIQTFVPPARGSFVFPAPYNTQAVRITEPGDCGGKDCVWSLGYAYWRNTNAHQGSEEMLIFLGLAKDKGGTGPTLFTYNKRTGQIRKGGSLFPPGSRFANYTGEGWYFSATQPTKLYVNEGAKMFRYDVAARQFETVYDVSSTFGANRKIRQMHSSNDDRVHTATLQAADTGEALGCVVFMEAARQFRFYPKIGRFDECHVDRSGRWTVSLEDIGIAKDVANRVFDNESGKETRLTGPKGTLGHLDMGYGYMVGSDNHHPLPNATVRWNFEPTMTEGPVVHYNPNWDVAEINHTSHANAQRDVPPSRQYACGSDAGTRALQNEITCVRLDGSNEQLIVAPVMTDLDAPGGVGSDSHYAKQPKGNLDITGRYFIWTTNLCGNRMDAFLVKVPAHLLVGDGTADMPPPETHDRLDEAVVH
jgi:hypothetical protein